MARRVTSTSPNTLVSNTWRHASGVVSSTGRFSSSTPALFTRTRRPSGMSMVAGSVTSRRSTSSEPAPLTAGSALAASQIAASRRIAHRGHHVEAAPAQLERQHPPDPPAGPGDQRLALARPWRRVSRDRSRRLRRRRAGSAWLEHVLVWPGPRAGTDTKGDRCTSGTRRSTSAAPASCGPTTTSLLTPEIAGGGRRQRGRRPGRRARSCVQMARRRLARHRLAQRVRRPGPRPDRAVHLLRRVDAGRRAGADAHDQLGRADDHAATASQEQKDFFLPKILAGEIHFSIGYTEPDAGTDLASLKTLGRARRRRVRHQRPEGLHQPRHRRRLHLARRAHQPRREEAQGHLDHHRPDRHARASRSRRSATSATSTPTTRSTRTCGCRREQYENRNEEEDKNKATYCFYPAFRLGEASAAACRSS